MDISSLRERRSSSEFSVTELNSYVKQLLDNDRLLSAVSVKGEISNFTYHRTGHLYFSLKDEGSQVKAVMFRSSAASLKFMPENGMKVIVRCNVGVYVNGGSYQLYVTSMQPDGIGALYLAYEQLKSKLEAEGLFSYEYKKNIPLYPSKIGVITAPGGAAVRDIINVIGRRYPIANIYLYPALVQGEGAVANLISGLDYFDKSGLVDIVIIGRGGGSIEDLWAFNSEELARKIFACKIPVISAVGHETDFTICDFVADLRAPTPSAAAEIATPDKNELLMRFDTLYDRCENALKAKIERNEDKLQFFKNSIIHADVDEIFGSQEEKIASNLVSLKSALDKSFSSIENKMAIAAGKLNALSPLATLARGYSVASINQKVLTTAKAVSVGAEISIRFIDGEISASVTEKRNYND